MSRFAAFLLAWVGGVVIGQGMDGRVSLMVLGTAATVLAILYYHVTEGTTGD